MWGGRPARLMRALTEAEQARNAIGAPGYAMLAQAHLRAIIDS